MKRETKLNVCLFVLLVAIGAAGRWLGARDEWGLLSPNFTPMAAIGLFAGYLFANRWLALAVPVAAMALSNLYLASYHSWLMPAAVVASFMTAPLLGRIVRSRPNVWRTALVVVAPAAFFFVTTNFVHWFDDGYRLHAMYGRGWGGLMACYAAGLPFFRWMLEGDVVFAAVLFGSYVLANRAVAVSSPLVGVHASACRPQAKA